MGEAKCKRQAAYRDGPWPGSAGRCPQCFGTRVVVETWDATAINGGSKFYSDKIAICATCRIAWEPIDETHIWDRSDPCCSSSEMCENCAFRPGSIEQSDVEQWKKTIGGLKAGGGFYCHKGVPLAPDKENGFAYSKVPKTMRLCRGYLNMIGTVWGKRAKGIA